MSRPQPLPLSPVGHSPDAPPSIFLRLYTAICERDWKRPVIALATFNTLRFAFQANTSFRDMNIDLSLDMKNLASVSFPTAGVFAGATLVEIFGIITGVTERLPYARIYLFLSIIAAVFVSATTVVNIMSYRALKDDLMSECISLLMKGALSHRSTFTNGKWPSSTRGNNLSEGDASGKCLAAWSANLSRHSFAIILLHLLPNILVISFPYAYYRQLSSNPYPQSARAAPSAIPLNDYPDETRYTPLYNTSTVIHRNTPREPPPPLEPVVIPVSSQFSPSPPSFSMSPEGRYPVYDVPQPEYDKSV